MYFSEVDVQLVRQSRSREPVATSLTNVKSSDDISSGYSSGELQSQKSPTSTELPLVRTASVGARNRSKVTRSSAKKSPEVEEEALGEEPLPSVKQFSPQNPLSFLTAEQTLGFFTFLSQNKDYFDSLKQQQQQQRSRENVNSDSNDESSTLKAETADATTIWELETEDLVDSSSGLKAAQHGAAAILQIEPEKTRNEEICSEKLAELKDLLQSVNETVATVASSRENLDRCDVGANSQPDVVAKSLEIKSSADLSRSSSDASERAGRYNKKPAPKAPEAGTPTTPPAPPAPVRDEQNDDELEEGELQELEEKALKATLVIKTGGTVKSFTESSADAASAGPPRRRKKPSAKTAARESFSRLLTIPKTIFHTAFHKDELKLPPDSDRPRSEENLATESPDLREDSSVYVSLKPEEREENEHRKSESTNV